MPDVFIFGVTPEMAQHWGWFLAFGGVLLLLGVAAIVRCYAAPVGSMAFFGRLLILGSVSQFIMAFMVGNWSGIFLHLLIAIIFGVVGIMMVTRRTINAETWTTLIATLFLIAGLYQLIVSLWTHPLGWGWQVLSGVVTTVLGALLLAGWPATGLSVIGLFIGIDLVFFGWAWIMLAVRLHKM